MVALLIGISASTYGTALMMQTVDILGATIFLSGVVLTLVVTGSAIENEEERKGGAGRVEIDATDETVRKYEMLGKIIQENADGLAALEEEKPAEKKRKGGNNED